MDGHSQSDSFVQRLRDSLRREAQGHPITVEKRANVYTCGEQDDTIYFIERGQVKLVTASPGGKEYMIALRTAGDVFGELNLSGAAERIETATAMVETVLTAIPSPEFFAFLTSNSLLEGFVRYLAMRIAEQQEVIFHLVTAGSESRLGQTLLQLAHTLGKRDSVGLLVEQRITHEELSEMVGTTRPRVSVFMQHFRNLGLIETGPEHSLIVKERRLTDYLAHIA